MKEFAQLHKIVRRLRGPKGCPWDRAQDVFDVSKYFLEEGYELVEGVWNKEVKAVREELGDLFLLLVFMAHLFHESGAFTLREVLEGVNAKLVARHPHVFSTKQLQTKDAVYDYWIRAKAKKKKRKTLKDRLPLTAPSLFLADMFLREFSHLDQGSTGKCQKRAQSLLDKAAADIAGVSRAKNKRAAFTDVLFSIVEAASLYGLELETPLRRKVLRKAGRVRYAQPRTSRVQETKGEK